MIFDGVVYPSKVSVIALYDDEIQYRVGTGIWESPEVPSHLVPIEIDDAPDQLGGYRISAKEEEDDLVLSYEYLVRDTQDYDWFLCQIFGLDGFTANGTDNPSEGIDYDILASRARFVCDNWFQLFELRSAKDKQSGLSLYPDLGDACEDVLGNASHASGSSGVIHIGNWADTESEIPKDDILEKWVKGRNIGDHLSPRELERLSNDDWAISFEHEAHGELWLLVEHSDDLDLWKILDKEVLKRWLEDVNDLVLLVDDSGLGLDVVGDWNSRDTYEAVERSPLQGAISFIEDWYPEEYMDTALVPSWKEKLNNAG